MEFWKKLRRGGAGEEEDQDLPELGRTWLVHGWVQVEPVRNHLLCCLHYVASICQTTQICRNWSGFAVNILGSLVVWGTPNPPVLMFVWSTLKLYSNLLEFQRFACCSKFKLLTSFYDDLIYLIIYQTFIWWNTLA